MSTSNEPREETASEEQVEETQVEQPTSQLEDLAPEKPEEVEAVKGGRILY